MKKLLILAMLLSGCTSTYEYTQTDYDDLTGREVKTHVTETEKVDKTAIVVGIASAGIAALIVRALTK
jgi:hypothetical protein